MTRVSFLRGEPMRRDKLVKGGAGGFMSAILPAGMRAVAIKIDNGGDSEAGGFILPNDRVDVVRVYRDDEATKARGAEVMGSQTILANVRILAIGQNVQEENGKLSPKFSAATIFRSALSSASRKKVFEGKNPPGNTKRWMRPGSRPVRSTRSPVGNSTTILPASMRTRNFLTTERPIARDALTARSPPIGTRNNFGEAISGARSMLSTAAVAQGNAPYNQPWVQDGITSSQC
jgi:hypothetical protein